MNKFVRVALGVACVSVCLGAGIGQRYIVINTTPSFPIGIYIKEDRPARKGDLVLVCPPDRPIFREAMQCGILSPGICPGGMGYLIKRLAATGGDYVSIAAEGVEINGERLENSQRQSFRLGYMEKAPYCETLESKEVLLMSPHPLSFDSRYFGAVPASTIQSPLSQWSRKE